MDKMDEIDKEKIDFWRSNKGSFVVADYKTRDGIVTAMGRLESVSNKGDVIVQHLNNADVSWGFNIQQVESHKFSHIKNGGNNDTSAFKATG